MTPHPAQLAFARGLPVASVEGAGDGASVETVVAGAACHRRPRAWGKAGCPATGSGDRCGDPWPLPRSATSRRSARFPRSEASAIPIRCADLQRSSRVAGLHGANTSGRRRRGRYGAEHNRSVRQLEAAARGACESADLCTVPYISLREMNYTAGMAADKSARAAGSASSSRANGGKRAAAAAPVPRRNHLLAALPESDYERLAPHLEPFR